MLTQVQSLLQASSIWFGLCRIEPHITLQMTPLPICTWSFDSCLIAQGISKWLPHSPDLSPLDLWLWEAAKGSVYTDNPTALAQHKLNDMVNYVQQLRPWGRRLRTLWQELGVPQAWWHISSLNYKKWWFYTCQYHFVLSCVNKVTVTVLKMAWCLFSINSQLSTVYVVIFSL